MKKIVISFLAVGILAILISVFGGGVQPTNDREFGAAQLLGVEIGIGLILLGIGIAVTKLDDSASAWVLLHEAHDKIQRLPAVFWILFAFFLTYLTFFLFPVFLNSHHKIDYVAGYIRDQGRIGFDIRSIVERIENWFILGQSPYSDGFIAYPPLTIAVFAPLVLAGFPGYFYLVTTLTLFCFVVSTLAVPRLIFKQGQVFLIFLFFFTGLFSYGFQFELERGQFNAIAFSLCVIAVFLFHLKSEFNYWAYLLFTISVQLKVYPIFFIVMFVKDWRDWKNNLRRFLGLAALSFSILFVLGYQIFRDFLRNITAYQFNYDSNRNENLSIKGFVHSLGAGDIPYVQDKLALLVKQNSASLELVFFALLGISLAMLIWRAYSSKNTGLNPYLLTWCVICSLVVPSVSNDYKLSVLVAPTAIMAMSLTAVENIRGKTLLSLLIFIYFLAYWSTLYPFTAKPDVLSRNFPALMIMLLILPWLNYLVEPRNTTSQII